MSNRIERQLPLKAGKFLSFSCTPHLFTDANSVVVISFFGPFVCLKTRILHKECGYVLVDDRIPCSNPLPANRAVWFEKNKKFPTHENLFKPDSRLIKVNNSAATLRHFLPYYASPEYLFGVDGNQEFLFWTDFHEHLKVAIITISSISRRCRESSLLPGKFIRCLPFSIYIMSHRNPDAGYTPPGLSLKCQPFWQLRILLRGVLKAP